MLRDIRDTPLYMEAEALYQALRRPGTGQLSAAAELNVAAGGKQAVFSGTLLDRLDGALTTRICRVDLDSGDTRVLTFGPHTDRLPRYSPDGRRVAFLSDRTKAGDFQLYLLDSVTGAARSTPPVDGWVEYLHWSPDGSRILLGVAGRGADVAGGQGAVASDKVAEKVPSWMPTVETGADDFRWRRAWVYELAADRVRQVSLPGSNLWEVAWCGNGSLAAIASPGSGEGQWYSARLHIIDVETGEGREIFSPRDQLGCLTACSAGKHLAVVEALCSDRWIVAGELLLIDVSSGKTRRIDTRGVDVTHTEWRSERQLLVAGHRGLETVVGLCDVTSGTFTETWRSSETSTGGFYVSVSGLDDQGAFAMVGGSFVRAPEIAVIRSGDYRAVKSFDVGYDEAARVIGAVQRVSWKAPDQLEIMGWLLLPKGSGPHPLVMNVHGGPVWHWRPMWLAAFVLMLVKRGYAVFFPNPRGSSGRGRDFIRPVVGDMGGADTHDYLSGLDHLVALGIADPRRLGVTGGSYGGFMTSWLITQDQRFAAAVSVAPVTNQVTQHLVSNIPHFVEMFLADRYTSLGGKYFERSPVLHAHKARTPTLNICGALDRCTPAVEALQFHNALRENGVKSVLVTYPEEGHGVRKFPAAIDYAARIVAWFEEHIPAQTG